jgi:hypothetical protein
LEDRPWPTDERIEDQPKWRAADLLVRRNGDTEESTSTRRRDRARDAGERPAAPLPDTRAERRHRSEPAESGSGRRHAPEDTQYDPSSSHRDDTAHRHGDENRHSGAPSRVPPTQWAWPKEPVPASSDPLPTRRAADSTDTPWSAADLLDEGKHAGGRRRARPSTRHGKPDDDDAGRHYRP